MITRPNYLEVTSESGELLSHVQRIQNDGEIDALIVQGGYDRLTEEQRELLRTGITNGNSHENYRFANKLLEMLVPDLAEVKAYHTETADTVMFDFKHEEDDKVLAADMVREPGQKSYAHIDLPIGMHTDQGYEKLRAVSSLSIAAGVGSAQFLAKRFSTLNNSNDLYHEFLMNDYLCSEWVEEIEKAAYITQEGWAMTQNPGDIIIFPQFDRPTVHQVAPQPFRTSVVYSTYITSRYAAYNATPEGIERPYVQRT